MQDAVWLNHPLVRDADVLGWGKLAQFSRKEEGG